MQIIYVSTLMSKAKANDLINKYNISFLQSIQRYNQLLCEGLVSNNINVKTITAMPISNKNSTKIFWKADNEVENEINYNYLPFINLPFFRQFCFLFFTFFYVLFYILFSKQKPIFICDILKTTTASVTLFLAKLFNCKCIALVTDLPKDMKSSKKLSQFINIKLQNCYDYYILLTKYMNEQINLKKRPYVIIEGICDDLNQIEKNNKSKEKYIMYAGGLYERYGIKELITGFIDANLKDVKLLLYGTGDLVEYIKNLNNENVIYCGVATNEEILEKEINATLLVNPRFSDGDYTKYSFPSKNIEYMSSGTPVLTTKLKGIPDEYNDYTFILENESSNGIKDKLTEIFSKSSKKLTEFGKNAQKFVLKEKNKVKQASKIKKLINQKNDNTEKTSKGIEIYGIFLLFLTILLSRNTLINSTLIGLNFSTYILTFLYLPIIYRFFYKKLYQKKDLSIIILFIFIFIGLIFKDDFKPYNLYIILVIFLAYIYIKNYDLKSILKWFCYIMFFLSCYSFLIEYFIYPIMIDVFGMDILSESSLHFVNSVGTNFLNMIFTFPVMANGYIRNFGIFTEPGYYQFYLIVALLIVMFNKNMLGKKMSNIFISIYTLVLLSTFSTAGYICLLIIGIYFFTNLVISIKKKSDIKDVIILLLLIAVFILFLIFIISTNSSLKSMVQLVFSKLISKSNSTSTRLNGIFYTLNLGLKNPLFGTCIYVVIDKMIIANTNFAFTALYGMVSGLILLILQYQFAEKISNNKLHSIIILIAILLSANNHFFVAIQSFWILMLLGLKEE